jgi:NAD(P)-dependent dehydrogenase (short-subunit alcohol dehydrogenase family)
MTLTKPDYNLSGKAAIVTGAASGIGKATAQLFAGAGASVVIADLNLDAAQAVADEINGAGGKAIAAGVDIADEAQVQAMTALTVKSFGSIDILVNNAAFRGKADFMEMSVDQWDQMFDVIARGTFLCMREAIKVMRDSGNGGAIVNISSVGASHTTIFCNAHYDAAKAGVDSLTRSAAVEFAPNKIRVNSIQPGGTDTEGSRKISGAIQFQGPIRQPGRVLLARRAEPSELANAILFLASPQSSFITGQVLAVDGGFLVG